MEAMEKERLKNVAAERSKKKESLRNRLIEKLGLLKQNEDCLGNRIHEPRFARSYTALVNEAASLAEQYAKEWLSEWFILDGTCLRFFADIVNTVAEKTVGSYNQAFRERNISSMENVLAETKKLEKEALLDASHGDMTPWMPFEEVLK